MAFFEMFQCPQCQARLTHSRSENGDLWACTACGGRAARISLLRKAFAKSVVEWVWDIARKQKEAGPRACPICAQRMVVVPASSDAESVRLDVCTLCHIVWFDHKEFEQVGALVPPPGPPSLRAARPAVVPAVVSADQATPEYEAAQLTWWRYIPAIIGMPVEVESPPLQRRPVATWVLAGSIACVSGVAFSALRPAVGVFGLIPAQALRHGGLTLVTSFFLHGGLLHLFGNLYFLLVFGDNVEDVLGLRRYLLLLVGATIGGDLLHILFSPGSSTPIIGASGGISGLIVFYGLQFPMARLGLFVRFVWVKIRAKWALGFWFVWQYIGMAAQAAGGPNIAYLAHIGGAVVGFTFWLASRKD